MTWVCAFGGLQGHKCASVREMSIEAEEQLAKAAKVVERRAESLDKVTTAVVEVEVTAVV